jgi:hypothetical protein
MVYGRIEARSVIGYWRKNVGQNIVLTAAPTIGFGIIKTEFYVAN